MSHGAWDNFDWLVVLHLCQTMFASMCIEAVKYCYFMIGENQINRWLLFKAASVLICAHCAQTPIHAEIHICAFTRVHIQHE